LLGANIHGLPRLKTSGIGATFLPTPHTLRHGFMLVEVIFYGSHISFLRFSPFPFFSEFLGNPPKTTGNVQATALAGNIRHPTDPAFPLCEPKQIP
jgi:hypothetical protein